jgi:ABC-type transport system involved in multi-copper enzyme maturation permease subunit
MKELDVGARLGPGPVFVYEWLTTSRRWQLYAMRALYVGAILVGMILVARVQNRTTMAGPNASIQALAAYGQTLFLTVITIELTVVLLVGPALTAGAVCIDKLRGTLDHMLATDLSNGEIVLGKLGVRLVPVLGLVACVLPIMALAGLLGGIDPNALFGSFMAAIACAVLGCSLALTLSVWGRKSHEVLMITYLIMILWLFGPFLLATILYSTGVSGLRLVAPVLREWLEAGNPYYLAWAPYTRPGSVSLINYVEFLGCCLVISGFLAGLATCRIRAVARKQAGRSPGRRLDRWLAARLPVVAWQKLLPGPSLDGNPVFWREWYRAKPSPVMQLIWALYGALGVVWVVIAVQSEASGSSNRHIIATLNVFQVGVGLLLLSVSAATSLAEERMRGSLDVLLATPLSTREILAGKWAGAFRTVPALLLVPAVTALLLAGGSGRWIQYVLFVTLLLAYSALIVSMGLALATWQSRLGRAVASCVAGYVALTIGWPAMAIPLAIGTRMNDRVILPLVCGSPFYGTLFGTLGLAGPHLMPGNAEDLWIGCVVWIVIDGGLAALLFAVTVASFDRCLGRISETDMPAYSGAWKKPMSRFELESYDDPRLAEYFPNAFDPPIGGVEPRGSAQPER